MIRLYCARAHGKQVTDCPECSALLHYAKEHLRRCRYGNGKPACRKCTTHCYTPEYRDRIRNMMRLAGPRMLFLHPLAALRHLAGF